MATLGDIRDPGSPARIRTAGGSYRQRQERVRQVRWRPRKELIEFRALSRTMQQAAFTAGRLERMSREQQEVIGAFQSFMSDMGDLQQKFALPGETIPSYWGQRADSEEVGPATSTQRVSLDTPDSKEKAALTEAARNGVLPPTENPLALEADTIHSGEAMGGQALRRLYEYSRAASQWQGEITADEAAKIVFQEAVRNDPSLDPNAVEYQPKKLLGFIQRYSKGFEDWRMKVDAQQQQNRTKESVDQSYFAWQSAADSHTDPTSERRRQVAEEDLDAYWQSAANDLTENIERLYTAGVVSNTKEVGIRHMMTYLDHLQNSHQEPDELHDSLADTLEIFRRVKMGKTGVAYKDPDFIETVESRIAAMMGRAGSDRSRGYGRRSSKFTRELRGGINVFLDEAGTNVTMWTPTSVKHAENLHTRWVNETIAANPKWDSEEIANFKIDAEQELNALQARMTGMSQQQVGASGSPALLYALGEDIDTGYVDGVEDFMRSARLLGALSGADIKQLEAKLGEMETASEFRRPGSQWTMSNAKIAGSMDAFRALAGPLAFNQMEQVVRETIAQMSAAHRAAANESKRSSDPEREARWWQQTGNQQFDQLNQTILDRAESLKAEMAQWTDMRLIRARPTAEQIESAFNNFAPKHYRELVTSAMEASKPPNLLREVEGSYKAMSMRVADRVDELVDTLGDASDPEMSKLIADTMKGKHMTELHVDALEILDEIARAGGAENLSEAFVAKFEKKVEDRRERMVKEWEERGMKDKWVQQARTVGDAAAMVAFTKNKKGWAWEAQKEKLIGQTLVSMSPQLVEALGSDSDILRTFLVELPPQQLPPSDPHYQLPGARQLYKLFGPSPNSRTLAQQLLKNPNVKADPQLQWDLQVILGLKKPGDIAKVPEGVDPKIQSLPYWRSVKGKDSLNEWLNDPEKLKILGLKKGDLRIILMGEIHKDLIQVRYGRSR